VSGVLKKVRIEQVCTHTGRRGD